MPKKLSKKQMISFREKVFRIVKRIPKGKVKTYKAIAKAAGLPAAFRAVGNVLNKYDVSKIKIPCHRVIKSDGKIGGYRYGTKKKIDLLKKEGIMINPFGKLRVNAEQSRSIKNGKITPGLRK